MIAQGKLVLTDVDDMTMQLIFHTHCLCALFLAHYCYLLRARHPACCLTLCYTHRMPRLPACLPAIRFAHHRRAAAAAALPASTALSHLCPAFAAFFLDGLDLLHTHTVQPNVTNQMNDNNSVIANISQADREEEISRRK